MTVVRPEDQASRDALLNATEVPDALHIALPALSRAATAREVVGAAPQRKAETRGPPGHLVDNSVSLEIPPEAAEDDGVGKQQVVPEMERVMALASVFLKHGAATSGRPDVTEQPCTVRTPPTVYLDAHRESRTFVGDYAPARRWADAVVAIAAVPADPSIVTLWANLLHMSHSTLCNRSRAVGAVPRDSLAFGRLARGITLGEAHDWRPEDVLDLVDPSLSVGAFMIAAVNRVIVVGDSPAASSPSSTGSAAGKSPVDKARR